MSKSWQTKYRGWSCISFIFIFTFTRRKTQGPCKGKSFSRRQQSKLIWNCEREKPLLAHASWHDTHRKMMVGDETKLWRLKYTRRLLNYWTNCNFLHLQAHAAATARHTGRQPDSQVQPTHTPINTDSKATRLSTVHNHFQLDTAQR
jgi:hypothetical protein